MKHGKSREIIASNIKEMMRAGHPKAQAIAAALSHSRKMADGGIVDTIKSMFSDDEDDTKKQHKAMGDGLTQSMDKKKASDFSKGFNGDSDDSKMAHGGAVEGDYDLDGEHERGLYDLMREGDQPPVANPEEQDQERALAKRLLDHSENMEYMAMGGMVEDMDGDETPEPHESGGSAESMDDENREADEDHSEIEGVPGLSPSPLSKEAMAAIAMKKMKRRFK